MTRRHSKMFRSSCIDRLESRRMMAVFNGTEGDDVIRITTATTGTVFVSINGASPQTTSDLNVLVNALGGNDTVYFPGLKQNQNTTPKNITVDMGAGNDYATNYNVLSGLASFNDIEVGVYVIGGDGTDTLSLDNTDGGRYSIYDFKSNSLDSIITLGPTSHFLIPKPEFKYGTTMENLTIDGSAAGDSFYLEGKLPGLHVTVNGQGGNDYFSGGYYQPSGWGTPEIAVNFSQNGWVLGSARLTGGAGDDTIAFEDRYAGGGQYVHETFALTKGGAFGFSYFTIEDVTINAAPSSEVFFNTMSSITNSKVTGQNCAVSLGTGDLGQLYGTFDFSLSGASSSVNVYDGNDSGNDNYLFTAGRLEKNPFVASQIIDFSGVSQFRLDANHDGNNIFIRGVTANTTLTINAGPGNDSIRVDSGNIDASILAPMFLNGGFGTDEIVFDNSLDTTVELLTLNGATFTDGFAHTMSGAETVIITAGGGAGTVLDLQRVTALTLVSARTDGFVNIGNGNLDANLLADVQIYSGGQVTLDDRLDTGNDGYIVEAAGWRKTTAGAREVEFGGNIVSAILQANDGHNLISVNQGDSRVKIFGNGGNDEIQVHDSQFIFTVQTVSVDTGAEQTSVGPLFGDVVSVNTNGDSIGAAAQLLASDTIHILIVNAGGTFRVPTGATGDITGALVLNGTIDLAGGSLLKRAAATGPTLPQFRAALTAGRNGGAWNGTNAAGAINSSLAATSLLSDGVGYGLGSQIAVTTIGGFAIAAGDTLIRHTLNGDANLNQQVNLDDFTALAASFGTGNSWVRGDSDYDSAISLNDFTALAANFGSSVGSVLPLAVRRPSPQPGDGPVFPFASLFSGRMIEIVDLN